MRAQPGYLSPQEDQAARYGNNAALLLGCLRPDRRVACLRDRLGHSQLSLVEDPRGCALID